MTRIDAHHHLWDPARADYPWMTDELAPIRRRFDLDDLRPLLARAAIDRTVLVQTRSSTDETKEFLALAEPGDPVAGVVGWVDLTARDVAETIDRFRALPGGRRLVAIRHQVHDEPDPRWLDRSDVRRGLDAVAAAGLAYDFLVRTRELPAAVDAARALPGARFVLDHAAKPPIASRDLGLWRQRLEALAALPNVACKISGLVTEANWTSWTSDDLRPVVGAVVDAFGPERTMFGSDWPVCLVAADYPGVIGVVEELTADLTGVERDRVFGGTAIEWYGLDVR